MAHPYASPIFYENKSGLAPATSLTAEFDPLRDVGKAYAEELIKDGVQVNYREYPGLVHGFANFIGFVPEARSALAESAELLNTPSMVEAEHSFASWKYITINGPDKQISAEESALFKRKFPIF